MNSIFSNPIKPNTRFVALYGDGSGANLFMTDDKNRLLNTDGKVLDDEYEPYLVDSGYLNWIALPNKFKLWFEHP